MLFLLCSTENFFGWRIIIFYINFIRQEDYEKESILLVIIVLMVTGWGKKEESKANLNSLKEELRYNKKMVDDGY